MTPFQMKPPGSRLAGVWFFFLAGVCLPAAETAGTSAFHKQVQPILEQYCYQCHGGGKTNGNVAFDKLASDSQILDHNLWSKALVNLRAGIMPPSGEDRPAPAELKQLEDWVKYDAFGINPKDPDPGRVTLRRLNRVEYQNTIHDLMGVDYNVTSTFPPDDTGYGFDDIGDVLSVSPMLLEKYMIAATAIVDEAVPKVARVVPRYVIDGIKFRAPVAEAGTNSTNGVALGGGGRGAGRAAGRGGVKPDKFLGVSYYQAASASNTFNASVAGTYKVALELAVKGAFEFDPGKCRVIFKVDGHEVLNKEFGWGGNVTYPAFTSEEKWQPGSHQLSIELQPLTPEDQRINSLEMRIDSVTIEGPMDEKYWNRPTNYERFFTGDAPEEASARRKAARKVLDNFTRKAFRRPADAETLDRLVGVAEGVYTHPGKTFEAGIGSAMVAALSSPKFLFRIEQLESAPSREPYPLVDEYSLASRLSYFLWSTMPDEELFRLAAQGQLRKNLPAEIKRMLKDPRSEALVDNFTGQWLQVRDMDAISINSQAILARDKGTNSTPPAQRGGQLAQNGRGGQALAASGETGGGSAMRANSGTNSGVVSPGALLASADGTASGAGAPAGAPARVGNPNAQANGGRRGGQRGLARGVNGQRGRGNVNLMDADMRRSMERETQMVFSEILHENRSVLELIDSDHTFLNQKLATFYGMTNLDITGADMQRVTLPPDSPRGGVLTEGTFLVVTSNPDRTSPVKRGLFVLSHILGSPPPPPPANIPALEVAEKGIQGHDPTLREILKEHRSNPECSACHSRLDPLGLGFENFNAMGMWREQERGQTIEPAGQLISGESFQGVRELKHILATKHSEEFYRCLTEEMLTYATGRGMEYYDTESVDRIVQKLDAEDGRSEALLTGIIESAPFQRQRRQANATFSGGPAAGVKPVSAN